MMKPKQPNNINEATEQKPISAGHSEFKNSAKRDLESTSIDHWNGLLNELVSEHFIQAHSRVADIYQHHYGSVKHTFLRHWRNKADVPNDLIVLPRTTFRLIKKAFGGKKFNKVSLSKKEKELAHILSDELLQVPQLEAKLFDLVRMHPSLEAGQWDELQRQLQMYSPEIAKKRIDQALINLSVTQEGSRDAMIFLTLGIISRSMTDKVAFGSAVSIGASAAGTLYISQQSFFGALWVNWFGLPAWVGLTGAAAGLAVIALATPVLSPMVEVVMNRFRSEKHLHKIVDQVHQDMFKQSPEASTLVGYMATYVQMVPDIIVALRNLKG